MDHQARKRILIIGSSGSGKSTLARKLGEAAGLPVVHLDRLYWRPDWQNRSNEEFDALLADELQKDAWIIDGNYGRTLAWRLQRCDTVIFFDLPRRTCLLGAVKRVVTNYGKTRPDMGDGCPERFDLDFLKWIWTFNRLHRQEYLELLDSLQDKAVYRIRSRKELPRLIRDLARKS